MLPAKGPHAMPATATRLLTATEAQIRSGRSMVRFRQWVAAGRLPFTVDEFGRRRFDAEDVDRLTAEVDRRQLQESQTTEPATLTAEPINPVLRAAVVEQFYERAKTR